MPNCTQPSTKGSSIELCFIQKYAHLLWQSCPAPARSACLFCLSCFGVFLSALPASPVLIDLSRFACPVHLSCSGCPFLVVRVRLFCLPILSIMAVLFLTVLSRCPFLAVLFWQPCLGRPVLAGLPWKSFLLLFSSCVFPNTPLSLLLSLLSYPIRQNQM